LVSTNVVRLNSESSNDVRQRVLIIYLHGKKFFGADRKIEQVTSGMFAV
jgi:hypothetical protein